MSGTPLPKRLVWIKRRARRIQRFYQVPRRMAIYDASLDYGFFFTPQAYHQKGTPS